MHACPVYAFVVRAALVLAVGLPFNVVRHDGVSIFFSDNIEVEVGIVTSAGEAVEEEAEEEEEMVVPSSFVVKRAETMRTGVARENLWIYACVSASGGDKR